MCQAGRSSSDTVFSTPAGQHGILPGEILEKPAGIRAEPEEIVFLFDVHRFHGRVVRAFTVDQVTFADESFVAYAVQPFIFLLINVPVLCTPSRGLARL